MLNIIDCFYPEEACNRVANLEPYAALTEDLVDENEQGDMDAEVHGHNVVEDGVAANSLDAFHFTIPAFDVRANDSPDYVAVNTQAFVCTDRVLVSRNVPMMTLDMLRSKVRVAAKGKRDRANEFVD